VPYTELEQRLLRFLKEEFLEKDNGGRMLDAFHPLTRHADVMAKFGLDVREYREVVTRLYCRGIIERPIAIGTTYGHLIIKPMVVEVVGQLDDLTAQGKPGERPPEGAKVSEHDVPAEFRDGGRLDGAVLTAPYLKASPKWLLEGPYLTNHYGKELTTHIKVGHAKAYLYEELLILRARKTDNQAEREQSE
jgi:hypothetical protein